MQHPPSAPISTAMETSTGRTSASRQSNAPGPRPVEYRVEQRAAKLGDRATVAQW
jgi:hypothetical protein